ncbi:MAG: hypothetical protein P3W93_004055, partial [Thermus sp.]|nr:hypothetical protein [Thermus sp.]
EATLLLLKQLERKGYVTPLSCKASCGLCSFRNVCPGPEATYWVLRSPLETHPGEPHAHGKPSP